MLAAYSIAPRVAALSYTLALHHPAYDGSYHIHSKNRPLSSSHCEGGYMRYAPYVAQAMRPALQLQTVHRLVAREHEESGAIFFSRHFFRGRQSSCSHTLYSSGTPHAYS